MPLHCLDLRSSETTNRAPFKLIGRSIPRPEIIHFYYQYAPLIDEHNKARQAVLALEKRWLTKDAWFRLLTTLVGMCVVDMFRIYRYDQIKIQGEDFDVVDSIRLLRFSDILCGDLRLWQYKQTHRRVELPVTLERARNKEGRTNYEPTKWQQEERNNSVGNTVAPKCFICRSYLDKDGKSVSHPTSFWCQECHMPLCKVSRVGQDGGREMTCVDEHRCAQNPILGCNAMIPPKSQVPKQVQRCLWPEREQRKAHEAPAGPVGAISVSSPASGASTLTPSTTSKGVSLSFLSSSRTSRKRKRPITWGPV